MREVVSCTLTVIVTLDTDGYKVEDRKTLCQLLGKLVLPSTADQTLLNTLYILITNLLEVRPYSFFPLNFFINSPFPFAALSLRRYKHNHPLLAL